MTKALQPKSNENDLWGEFDRQLDALRSRLLEPWGVAPFGPRAPGVSLPTGGFLRTARADVSDTGSAYKIVAEVPGIPKEKIDIRVRGPVVEIRGDVSTDAEGSADGYLHRERTYSGYYRALELPEPVVAADAKAKVENGVLELELPKLHPSATPDEVQVKVA